MDAGQADQAKGSQVRLPFRAAWREGTLTRAEELGARCELIRKVTSSAPPEAVEVVLSAVQHHIKQACQAVEEPMVSWRRRRRRNASRLERAISSLDAAECQLLQVAPAPQLLGQMPSILNHVQRHLKATDPRRLEIERIAFDLGVREVRAGRRPVTAAEDPPAADSANEGNEGPRAERGLAATAPGVDPERREREQQVDLERWTIVNAMRGACSAALREQTRVRSFRDVVVAAAIGMAIVAIGLGLVGMWEPERIPVCFAPESDLDVQVVCPTQESEKKPINGPDTDIDAMVRETVRPSDIFLVELAGVTAAAIAAAVAIRSLRGSSEPYGVPLALALLKLPTGAVTALLGLLLMRGEFVPGLSALDSSAQILAWAIVFGYAQQLFTRLVDQQAHHVLDSVRGGNKANEAERSA